MWVCLYTAKTLQLIDKFSRKLELSQKLIVARVAEKFSVMYGIRWFIIVFMRHHNFIYPFTRI